MKLIQLVCVIAISGCTAGGPDSPSSPPSTTPPPTTPPASPVIQVLPTTYDFGKVTPGNVPAPLEVTISNTGNAALNVSSITFRAPFDASFSLASNGGSRPCGSGSPTVAAGDRCTLHVAFQPSTTGSFAATLQISSNDRSSPATLPVAGASEPVAALTVRINQLLTTCPTNEVTAYVSVTDQGGYPVTGLQASNFSVTQEGNARPVLSLAYVDLAYKPIAVAAALDYSGSLTGQPVAFADMRTGFSSFFDSMRVSDSGEIVKFGSEIEVTQAFTTDKAKLNAAISAPFDKGSTTRLYDGAFQATNDTSLSSPDYRKAVIVATDGQDNSSTRTLMDVTNNAISKRIPIFAIGIGGSIDEPINDQVLEQLATATGGMFYKANTSQNLATIYQQLSSILYRNQYVMRFDQLVKGSVGSPSSVAVGASTSGVTGTSAAPIASCN